MTSTNDNYMNKPHSTPPTMSIFFRKRYLRGIAMFVLAGLFLFVIASGNTGCGYTFRDISIPDTIKVVKIKPIENRASYINTTLAPRLTDRLRQKIVSQTRLKQTNGDDADWEISATVTGYSFSTSGISNQQVATNRLTISIQIMVEDMKGDKAPQKYDVSRSFDFPASQSIQQAENARADEITRGLTDDIFNRIFSQW